jgi:methionyl aminopeptidase
MTIETARDLQGLLAAGRVVRGTIAAMEAALRPGVTTAELDAVAQQYLARAGARSAPMIEVAYPGATCISVNDEAAHGLPGPRRIGPGDLVTFDVAAELGGYYADAAVTVGVPPVKPAHQRLCRCAEEALRAAVQAARRDQPLRAIGRAAEGVAQQYGCRVVRALHGHGIGRRMHEAPQFIPHYDDASARQPLAEGLVLAIEPHLTLGSGDVVDDADGWTIRTRDRKRVAVFEHTVVVTAGEPIIVTAG